MEVQERRRRTTLSEQLSANIPNLSPTSSSLNLRDLLKVHQEDLHQEQRACGRRSASISLGTFLACEKRELSAAGLVAVTAADGGRTLLDVMRDGVEPAASGGDAVYSGGIIGSNNGGHKISWRAFRERLRVRRSGVAWQSAGGAGGNALGDVSAAGLIVTSRAVVPSSRTPMPEDNLVSASSVPEQNRSFSAVSSAREAAAASPRPPMPSSMANSPTRAAAGGQAEGWAATGATQQQPQQIRVSLMTLLEQTDRLGGGGGPGFAVSAMLGPAGEEEEEEEEEVGSGICERGKMYVKCCVCMVRHKGAAFIPCGHTFCRLCSRELWVARGSCPLCNGFILEILDIF